MLRAVGPAVALVVATAAPAAAGNSPNEELFFGPEPEPEPVREADCVRGRDWTCVLSAGDAPDPAPGELRESLARDWLEQVGARGVGHDAAAGWAAGAIRDDGGVALAGASSQDHRWLVEGVPIESMTSGAPGVGVPVRFLDRLDVITGGSPASRRVSMGATIDARLRDGDVAAAETWLRAGASAPRRVADPLRYDPLTLDPDDHRGVGVGVLVSAPWRGGPLDRQWGLVGYEGTLRTDGATRTAQTIIDADGDGVADTILEDHLDATAHAHAGVVRLGAGLGRHDLELTALGVGVFDPRLSADGVIEAAGQRRTDVALLGLAQWRSRWTHTTVAIDAGWFASRHRERGWTAAADDALQIGTAYIPSAADVPADAAFADACATGACPVPEGYYVRGGAGLLQQLDGDRPSVSGEVAHEVRWHGTHRVAAGAAADDVRLVITRRFTSGAVERRLAEDVVFTSRFVELDPDGADDCGELGACTYFDEVASTYRTRQLAAWLEDTWRPVRDVTAQAGVRWESMEIAHDVRFRDQLAPRIAIAVDPDARGRSRYFVTWARSYALYAPVTGLDVSGGPDIYTHLASSIGDGDSIDTSAPLAIDPDLQPAPLDELVVGAERIIQDAVHVGAVVRARWMMRGIDDVDGVLVNPGAGLADDAARLTRVSHDATVWLGTPPGSRLELRVAYIHSRQRGSWAGGADWTTDFDGAANAHGRLPNDLPHRLDVRAISRHALGGWQVAVGARLVASSGRPYSALGADGHTPLVARGTAGRLPPLGSATFGVSAVHGGWTLGLDLVNPFQVRTATAVDEQFTFDDTGPIHGGDLSDLMWAKRGDTEAPIQRSPGWGRATRFQAPAFVQISAARRF